MQIVVTPKSQLRTTNECSCAEKRLNSVGSAQDIFDCFLKLFKA